MENARIFQLKNGLTAESIGKRVENFLKQNKGLYAEGIYNGDSCLIQGKEEATWKKFAGMDKAIQVKVVQNGNNVSVEIGKGTWVDKAGAATIGLFVFAPLAVTAAIGAWEQRKINDEIFECIENYIFNSSPDDSYENDEPKNAPSSNMMQCPQCGKEIAAGAKFCDGCGTKLVKSCPQCNTEISLDKKFCPNCGCKLEEDKDDNIVICAKCGAELPLDTRFCPACGNKI